jgi:hypothetical protein
MKINLACRPVEPTQTLTIATAQHTRDLTGGPVGFFVSHHRHSNLLALTEEDPKDEKETSFRDMFGLQSH